MSFDVIGLIRFSLIAKNSSRAWEIARTASTDSLYTELFSETRLKKRFMLFENIVLPAFDGQTCKDFSLVIMVSDLLPEMWKNRLEEISKSRPYLKIDYYPADISVQSAALHSIKRHTGNGRPYVSFRNDDDDPVHAEFIAKVRAEVDARLQAGNLTNGAVLTMPEGAYLKVYKGEIIFGRVTYPMIGIGLCKISIPANGATIYNMGNHSKIDPEGAIIATCGTYSWIRSVYAESDSQLKRDVFKSHVKNPENICRQQLADILQDGYPSLSPEAVIRALSS